MEQKAAWKVIQTAFRCGRELQALLRFLKENCSTDEYQQYALAIATAVDAINVQLIDRSLKSRPELRQKIESDLAKFGQIT